MGFEAQQRNLLFRLWGGGGDCVILSEKIRKRNLHHDGRNLFQATGNFNTCTAYSFSKDSGYCGVSVSNAQ
jgi:hypothetical protein